MEHGRTLPGRPQAATPAPVDLSVLAAALVECRTGDGRADVFARRDFLALEQLLQQREQQSASALTRIAGLEAALQAD